MFLLNLAPDHKKHPPPCPELEQGQFKTTVLITAQAVPGQLLGTGHEEAGPRIMGTVTIIK